ncbi:MAG: tetraacyldisaccharide 4'-kinase [Gemmatimonadaceae bacterium]
MNFSRLPRNAHGVLCDPVSRMKGDGAARLIERVWRGQGAGPRAARAVLRPLSLLYGGGIALRSALYGAGGLVTHDAALPVMSVGNLSVGGTGKTPISAWLVGELRRAGAHPAIVLRGYGSDEPRVHELLNPGLPVVISPDRIRGIEHARAVGADIAVLDDAFQHRRAHRDADIVLVSADDWTDIRSLLPAGPWREPLRAIARASLALVTRKAASSDHASTVVAEITAEAPGLPVGIVHLDLEQLRAVSGQARDAAQESAPLANLRGARVLAVAGIGNPGSFIAQLEQAGALVCPDLHADHFAPSDADVIHIAAIAHGFDLVVCTLKDAVKLAARWPREAPRLWYVSQRVIVEQGRDAVDDILQALLRLRSLHSSSEKAGPHTG